jgi:hypothetical protein
VWSVVTGRSPPFPFSDSGLLGSHRATCDRSSPQLLMQKFARLRFAKDPCAEAGLRELITDAEARLRRWKPGGRRREFEAAPVPLPARVPAMPCEAPPARRCSRIRGLIGEMVWPQPL